MGITFRQIYITPQLSSKYMRYVQGKKKKRKVLKQFRIVLEIIPIFEFMFF
jgi:hypothetical protein